MSSSGHSVIYLIIMSNAIVFSTWWSAIWDGQGASHSAVNIFNRELFFTRGHEVRSHFDGKVSTCSSTIFSAHIFTIYGGKLHHSRAPYTAIFYLISQILLFSNFVIPSLQTLFIRYAIQTEETYNNFIFDNVII